ncbi:SMC-Scp complex subunit ScpB [Rubrobacter indicoceani]|uniref:SMC-Scp complex subunit ScpB n=1 Tax=Rubrobacter indicoceani TaxID=2051957 RepID=UPI000E5B729B|nr:SMC-Scp complex subunit ScpB [Rubrobacter indicoceani]
MNRSPENDGPVPSPETTDAPPASAVVEAVLFVSGRPVSRRELAALTELTAERLESGISALRTRCESPESGLVLREVAGGLQLATKVRLAPVIENYRGEARPSPLSAAALEVLSCVLYLGPVSRGGVSRVRGVNSDAVVRGLLERNLLAETGRESESPLAPALLNVTEDFFIASGAPDSDDFPPLRSLVSEEELARVRERVNAETGPSETGPSETGPSETGGPG